MIEIGLVENYGVGLSEVAGVCKSIRFGFIGNYASAETVSQLSQQRPHSSILPFIYN
jgi:hypothetical protein